MAKTALSIRPSLWQLLLSKIWMWFKISLGTSAKEVHSLRWEQFKEVDVERKEK